MKKITASAFASIYLLVPFLSYGGLLLAGNTTLPQRTGQSAIGEYGAGLSHPVRTARPFTTNAQQYRLESIILGAGIKFGFGNGSLQMSLYSNNIDRPGAPIINGDKFASLMSTQAQNPFSPSKQIVLDENTTYWIVLSADQALGATRYWWQWNETDDFISDVIGADLPQARSSAYGDGEFGASSSGYNFPADIYVTPIPEPSTCALTLLVSGGVWFIRRQFIF